MDLFAKIKRGHQTNVLSFIEYVEPNSQRNDLKIASFQVFFKMSLFEIQWAFLARYHGQNLNFPFNNLSFGS